MDKGQKYDQMIKKPQNDELGLFENYFENMKFIQEHICKLDPKQVYDIGCGTGNLTGPLSNEMTIIGVDKSDEMLLQAKTKYPRMEVVCEAIEKWTSEVDLSSRNLIISSFVLHSMQHKDDILNWFSEVISKDNTVIIVDYFFKNEPDRLNRIEKLKADHKTELWQLVESKYYLKIDEIETWCNQRNYKFQLTMFTHWIGMVEITNIKILK